MIQWITGILAATLLLTTPAIPAPEACIHGLRTARNGITHICCRYTESFVDENNDGICDNREHREHPQGNFTDEDGNGICDRRGHGNGKGNGHGRQRGKNK